MKPGRKTLFLTSAILIAVAAITARTLAVSYPLSTTAIRNAYFIGNRNDEQTAEFLSRYVRWFPEPKTGPYIRDIGIDTPFSDIVKRTQGRLNFYAPDAVQEYQHKPGGPLRVYVDIFLTPTYSPIPQASAPEYYEWVPDFWNDFKVRLQQGRAEIPAEYVRGGPIYSYGYGHIPLVTGARVELTYNPEKVDSESTQVIVLTPDGQTIQADFDLARLR
jgi:hypothetical protein